MNARDKDGNTPLHETFLTGVEEELLNLGEDVNAATTKGKLPSSLPYDDDAIALYLHHGADLSVRNNKGETVFDVAMEKGPKREEALRKAILELNAH